MRTLTGRDEIAFTRPAREEIMWEIIRVTFLDSESAGSNERYFDFPPPDIDRTEHLLLNFVP